MIGEGFFEEGASKLKLMGKKGPVMHQDHLVLSPLWNLSVIVMLYLTLFLYLCNV